MELSPVEIVKVKKSQQLVKELQQMFAEMLKSNVSYTSPKSVLSNIVDNNGGEVFVYEQKDIGEFMLLLLERM